MQIRDKKNRVKKTSHVGVFDTMDALQEAKEKLLEKSPNVTFEVYFCEHILFKQRSE
ncbi:hypothetical protein UFOVP242_92 [uncultured Caudovirales phage]|uniref:Uncharacterized protein n=1 Tax=uncultured Caudovirales phage TaxID=2100421 RepID=A0A6J7X3K0_9CAUD|nr:hypothetical protein UFOVP242_92 [uncultured Caudovirales phage]